MPRSSPQASGRGPLDSSPRASARGPLDSLSWDSVPPTALHGAFLLHLRYAFSLADAVATVSLNPAWISVRFSLDSPTCCAHSWPSC